MIELLENKYNEDIELLEEKIQSLDEKYDGKD
jgi:hypothetical protein